MSDAPKEAALCQTSTLSSSVDADAAASARKPGDLYPPIEPYNTGWLSVSEIHEIYYEECGNKDGNPVIYLHGGPGSGCFPNERSFFDPKAYRIIMLDQRGAGKSKPSSELKDNTTWDLVSDLEKLRKHLGVTKWVVMGGSWGSTLSLAYAQKHPDAVKALILWGICTLNREEMLWMYQEGASFLFPDKWEDFLEPIPKVERGDLMSAYYRRLTGSDKEEQIKCAKAWSTWEINIIQLINDLSKFESNLVTDEWLLSFARIECHYFVHGGWFPDTNYLLDNVDVIRHIPATVINGRYDVVTPMKTAWELHKRWPEAEFHIVPDGGHFYTEPGIQARLMEASEKYKNL